MEFLRAIGPVFNFLLLALALIFFTRKQIRKLFQERRDRIADALGRAADAQDLARHTAEDIAEAKRAADAEAHAQLAEAKAQAEANTAAADAETEQERAEVRNLQRQYDEIARIPADEYAAFTKLCSQRFCLRQLPCMAVVIGVVLCNDTGKFHR